MAPVYNGNPVDQTITNAAFMDRQVDTNTIGKVDLLNTDSASGASVTNLQANINSLIENSKIFMISASGSSLAWTSPTLTLSADILIYLKDIPVLNTIDHALTPSITLTNDGDSAWVTLNRSSNATVSVSTGSSVPVGKDIYRIATRIGTIIVLGNGQIIRSGLSRAIGDQFSQPLLKQEVPTGTINGSNTDFVLSQYAPDSNSVMVFLDSLLVPTSEYSMPALNTIRFSTAPTPPQTIFVSYVRIV